MKRHTVNYTAEFISCAVETALGFILLATAIIGIVCAFVSSGAMWEAGMEIGMAICLTVGGLCYWCGIDRFMLYWHLKKEDKNK